MAKKWPNCCTALMSQSYLRFNYRVSEMSPPTIFELCWQFWFFALNFSITNQKCLHNTKTFFALISDTRSRSSWLRPLTTNFMSPYLYWRSLSIPLYRLFMSDYAPSNALSLVNDANINMSRDSRDMSCAHGFWLIFNGLSSKTTELGSISSNSRK